MFDVGWQELALTGVVALVVLGPKELPGLMRTAGGLLRKARMIAHEFRVSLDELAEEAELEEFREKAKKIAGEKEPLLEDEKNTNPPSVIPAKAGIQGEAGQGVEVDSRLRGNDGLKNE